MSYAVSNWNLTPIYQKNEKLRRFNRYRSINYKSTENKFTIQLATYWTHILSTFYLTCCRKYSKSDLQYIIPQKVIIKNREPCCQQHNANATQMYQTSTLLTTINDYLKLRIVSNFESVEICPTTQRNTAATLHATINDYLPRIENSQ